MATSELWIVRNRNGFRHALRMLFGLLWGLDAGLKLIPGTVFYFQERMIAAGILQPPWLSGWFSFWLAQANAYGAFDVALVATLEFFLAVALITGLLRKTAYLGGIALSLFIWAIPEGFGGPYDPGTFDIGVGIVYAVGFLFLIALDAFPASNSHTLDEKIERRWPRWAAVAEVSGRLAPSDSGGSDGPAPSRKDAIGSPAPTEPVSLAPNSNPPPRRFPKTLVSVLVIVGILVAAGVAAGFAIMTGFTSGAGGCPSATARDATFSSMSNATFAAENAPPPGVEVNRTANTITVNSDNTTLLVEGAPRWYPRPGNYFLSYGLVDPQISVPSGTPIRFSFINMDNESHTFTLTTQGPPYPYMPMMSGGGMMGTGAGSCWLPVGAMMVNGTTVTGANPTYPVASATLNFAGTGTFWYLCLMPGHAQSGMYGLLTVRG